MKDVLRIALYIINAISFVCGFACVTFMCYCEFFGYNKGSSFLRKINFPLNDNGIIVACFICGAILILSIFLRKKFFR